MEDIILDSLFWKQVQIIFIGSSLGIACLLSLFILPWKAKQSTGEKVILPSLNEKISLGKERLIVATHLSTTHNEH